MIVFPMVGMSSRFLKAGYDKPKYMLPLDGGTCFDFSVMGFLGAYSGGDFVFIVKPDFDARNFVEQRLAALGVSGAKIVLLDNMTAGQADTVEKGLEGVDECGGNGLAIFNIDTFRPNFKLPLPALRGDGYLETFIGDGANWSFVEPLPGSINGVAKTTEKDPISKYCCTGFYHFSKLSHFRDAMAMERKKPSGSELYVAPIYNHLIKGGLDIRYSVIDSGEVVFCGVPAEYEYLRANDNVPRHLGSRFC